MAKKSNELFADIVEAAGIEYAFGMPGGVTPFVFDALHDKEGIRCVLSRHEGHASCMADMIARLTGKPALVIGQGVWIASNAAYGIMESYLAGTPMVIVTEVSDYANLAQHAPYQCGSGEYGAVDVPSILRSMTKYTSVAANADEFIHGVQLAIKHATSGRPGPCAVVTKWKAATDNIDPDRAMPKVYPIMGHLNVSPPCASAGDIDKAAAALAGAENPVLVAGQGARLAGAYDEVLAIAELLGMPVATSAMGKSILPETHDLAVGVMGRLGQAAANACVSSADILLVAGSGLAPENTMMLSPDYINVEKQKIIHIDIEPRNIGFTFPVFMGINAEVNTFLASLTQAIKEKHPAVDTAARIEAVKEIKKKNNAFTHANFDSDRQPVMFERIVKEVNDAMTEDDQLVVDAGNNRMFFTKHFQTKRAGQFIVAGGAAGIGWGVPSAIAAQMHLAGKRVVCVAGDGGTMLNLGALETARQHNLPVTFIIVNNASLGNVSDFIGADRRDLTEYESPNFAGIAKGMDFMTAEVEDPAKLREAIEAALAHDGPSLVDVKTGRDPHFTLMM